MILHSSVDLWVGIQSAGDLASSFEIIHRNSNIHEFLEDVTAILLQRLDNERDGVLNHRRLDCLLNRLLRCRSKKTSKLCVTCLCEGNLPVTAGFPSKANNAENVFLWWRYILPQAHSREWILCECPEQWASPLMWLNCRPVIVIKSNTGLILGLRPANERRRYFVPTALLCTDVSHWLGASLESAL